MSRLVNFWMRGVGCLWWRCPRLQGGKERKAKGEEGVSSELKAMITVRTASGNTPLFLGQGSVGSSSPARFKEVKG